MGRVGRYVQLKAREGQRDALVEHMLGAAQLLADVPGCELYVINTSATETDTVWVTEVWSTQAELDASLTIESVKASVEQVLPLLAGPPEQENFAEHPSTHSDEQGFRYSACSPSEALSGRNHKETCAGCIVSLTTPTRSLLSAFRSVSSLSLVEKASRVFAASYFLR